MHTFIPKNTRLRHITIHANSDLSGLAIVQWQAKGEGYDREEAGEAQVPACLFRKKDLIHLATENAKRRKQGRREIK